jgi:hypothetical protein
MDGAGHVYLVKGTSDWEAYAADYLAKHHMPPAANAQGGRWFAISGEAT